MTETATQQQNSDVKIIELSSVLSYIYGVFIALAGFGYLSQQVVKGMMLLLLGVWMIPYFRRRLHNELGISLSKPLTFFVVVFSLIVLLGG